MKTAGRCVKLTTSNDGLGLQASILPMVPASSPRCVQDVGDGGEHEREKAMDPLSNSILCLTLHSTNRLTLAALPLASITVNCEKPGPSGVQRCVRLRDVSGSGAPFASQR
jgi:hypothetical protein